MGKLTVAKELEACGMTAGWDKEKKRASIRGGLNDLLKFTGKIEKGEVKWQYSHNKSKAHEEVTDGNSSWKGGSLSELKDELAGKKDMTAQELEKERIMRSDLLEKVMTAMQQCSPKRRRSLDEHEGDWDMDRRWEIKPFNRSRRETVVNKVVDMECHFCVNGGVDSEELDKYGALIWAVSDIVEKAGIRTRVTLVIKGKHSGSKGSSETLEVEVKRPDEYVMPQLIAAAFTTNFFRRMGFALVVASADVAEQKVAYGLGRADSPNVVAEFTEGKLVLSDSLMDYGKEGYEKLGKALYQAITGKVT